MDDQTALADVLRRIDYMNWTAAEVAEKLIVAGVRVGDVQQNVSVNPSPDAGLREAAQAVVDAWDRDDLSLGWNGESDMIDRLRAALAGEAER